MEAPTSNGDAAPPKSERQKLNQLKPILEALNEDGSIDIELLKQISKECLIELNKRHDKFEYLANFHPDHMFYRKIGGKIEIEFNEPQNEPTEQTNNLSKLNWMAPEIMQENTKPTAASNIFTLGLVFYYLFTKRESPLEITLKSFKNKIKHIVKINLELLETLTIDTDTILFIDLIKRMIQEVPDHRETCKDLIDHVALKSDEGRFKIVQLLADKCFDGDKCINEYFVKMMNKKEVHMEGFLGEDSTEWKEFLAEIAKKPQLQPDIKTCSSLLKLFCWQAESARLKCLRLVIVALPNFLPHLYNIYREELPKVRHETFKEIFKHFNDAENSLGTGSYGTIVYRGKFGPREIAIKRVLKTGSKAVEREISIMMKIDRHPNILRYFAKEEDENFLYIGTELCECNLATFIRHKSLNMRQKMTVNLILKQSADGLNHLHRLNIIHRNIQPEKILIFHDNGTYTVKISGFGISKPLYPLTVLSTSIINIPGTIAWIAPEVGEKEHTKSSDVFSLGLVFYFVISDGTILWQELGMNYKDVEEKLKEKCQELNDQGKNKQLLRMDLLIKMLKLEPELRPSVEKVLHHAFFWENKRCLDFIIEIRKKFDVLDPKLARKFKDGMEYQKVLKETSNMQKLKVELDIDKSVIYNDWTTKLDKTLAKEFNKGYDKESVSDLLKAMGSMWMHKEKLKDKIKTLFIDGTESEFLYYFTSRFPRLLAHCYNAVEKKARDLLAEYFYLNEEELDVKPAMDRKLEALTEQDAALSRALSLDRNESSDKAMTPVDPIEISAWELRALTVAKLFKDKSGLKLEGSELTINCHDVLTFPETISNLHTLKIFGISNLFMKQNKLFTEFLQRNGSNVTQLEFHESSLTFDSIIKMMHLLPKLKIIKHDQVEINVQKTQPILILEVLDENGFVNFKLLKEITKECLEVLKKRHSKNKYNIRPTHIFYEKNEEKVIIEFRNLENDPIETIDSYSTIKWMAPEMIQGHESTAVSDIFTMGLVIFYLFTKGGSPLTINSKNLNTIIHYDVQMNLRLLDDFQTDTDSILFIDLIKKMVQEKPEQRETCENLINHAVFMNIGYWFEIVRDISSFDNYDLIKTLNKNKVHMEGFSGKEISWEEFFGTNSKLPTPNPNIKVCSSLVQLFSKQSWASIYNESFNCFKSLMQELPNFFPHLNTVYHKELPKLKHKEYKTIFKHNEKKLLGNGANETIVYEGKFDLRNIAIKRVKKDHATKVAKETSIMQRISHINILKYFAKEEDYKYIYIGIELCECNLQTFINDTKWSNVMESKTIMRESAAGLSYLHQLNILHRDIKPENILIYHGNGDYTIKLSDFGISKELNTGTTVLNTAGTPAWIAPEKKHTKSSDVFSLGCVFYFVISGGIVLSEKLSPDYTYIESKLKEMLENVLKEKMTSFKVKLEKIFNKDKQQQATHAGMNDQDKTQLEETLKQMFTEDKRHLQVMLEEMYNQDKKPLKEMLEKMDDQKKRELEEELGRLIIEYNESQHFLQMDLLSQILKLKPDTRPTAQQILHHPLCWDNKKSIEFIVAIRQKFDLLPLNLKKKNIYDRQILRETPIIRRLTTTLDKSYVNLGWKAKLDKTLNIALDDSYKDDVLSELLRAIRNKWTHKEEMKVDDKIKYSTETDYLNCFTTRFPELLMHCCNSVKTEAGHLFENFFCQDEESSEAPLAVLDTSDLKLKRSQYHVVCKSSTKFHEPEAAFDSLVIEDITTVFVDDNKLFNEFLQKHGKSVTEMLTIDRGSLKLDSVIKILENLPNLKKIQFIRLDFKIPEENLKIPQSCCKNLIELDVRNHVRKDGKELRQKILPAFEQIPKKKLTVWYPEVALEEILQNNTNLEELNVNIDEYYQVNDPKNTDQSIVKLKVLKIHLYTSDDDIHDKILDFIQNQDELQRFSFTTNSRHSPPFCKTLIAYIFKLEKLTSLEISGKDLLKEVEAFLTNSKLPNLLLKELTCKLNEIKYLPLSFLLRFANVSRLYMNCKIGKINAYDALVIAMNKLKLTAVKLTKVPAGKLHFFNRLKLRELRVLHVEITNLYESELVFEDLKEILENHPDITDFKLELADKYEQKSLLEFIKMIVDALKQLNKLQVFSYDLEIKPEEIKSLVELKKPSMSWRINDFDSKTFYIKKSLCP